MLELPGEAEQAQERMETVEQTIARGQEEAAPDCVLYVQAMRKYGVNIYSLVPLTALNANQSLLWQTTVSVFMLVLTAFGVLFGKIMYVATKGKVNPLIGSAGVSAVPMAARVSQKVGQEENPGNFLLMHAMGPNVAGVIGSAVAAGVLLQMCPGM